FDTRFTAARDGFVTKLDASGAALAYSTYLGGSSGDGGESVAADAAGNAYVTGGTSSTNFPTTTGAFDTTLDGTSDVFVTKLDASGAALGYSTYLGGSDIDHGDFSSGVAPGDANAAHTTADAR